MPSYIDLPLETDSDALAVEALDYLIANIPGFVPREGHLEVYFIEANAAMVAEARDVASRVPTTIFRYYGQAIVGLAPIDAAAASVTTTWTMVDDEGYTIEAGTLAGFRVAGDAITVFETVDEFTVAPGDTVEAGVEMRAVLTGVGGNGLIGVMELVDALAFVETVVATTVSANGVDGESDDDYLDRLKAELAIMSPRPILANDYAVLTRRVPGVARALALDGYNPADGTSNNERMVAVAAVDADGLAVGAGIKAEIDTLLESMREINFVVNVMDPTYTAISVDFTVKALDGYDHADVLAAAEAAVEAHIDPANWAGGDETPKAWRTNATVVRYLEVAAALNGASGVDYITALTVNGGTADVALAGAAPLPSVGAINGVVT